MSLAFQRALALTLGREGGFSYHKLDRGGKTKWGVTWKVYDAYRRKHNEAVRPVIDMDREEMCAIYADEYWEPARCGEMPLNLACCHFDAAVNHGVSRAAKLLQRAVSVNDDGKLGPQTMAALDAMLTAIGEVEVIRFYLAERKDFYADIISGDPSQAAFELGWNRRVDHLAKVLIDDTTA